MSISRTLCGALAAITLVSGCVMPVCAAAANDVPAGAWYSANVNSVLDQGIMSYMPGGLFCPEQQATLGELAEVICRGASLGARMRDRDEARYAPYLERLEGLIPAGYTGDTPVTRALASDLIVAALKLPACTYKPFADTDLASAGAIQQAGILNGISVNGEVIFAGDSPLTRAQLATLWVSISRYQEEHSQNTIGAISGTGTASSAGSLYAGIEDIGLLPDPDYAGPARVTTVDDFLQVLEYMAANRLESLDLSYPGEDATIVKSLLWPTITEAYQKAREELPGLFAMMTPLQIQPQNTRLGGILTFSYPEVPESAKTAQVKGVQAAWNALQSLYATGQVTHSMTEKERCGVYVQYLNRLADYRMATTAEDRYPITIFEKHYGNCEAWSGALQLMLLMDGIHCWGQMGDNLQKGGTHIWLICELDGERLHVDPSVDDDTLQFCFAWTDEQMSRYLSWEH